MNMNIPNFRQICGFFNNLYSGNFGSSSNHCNSCHFIFNLSHRKKRCVNCKLNFCSNCVEPGREIHCKRCLVFNQFPLNKELLSTLSVNDLKWFLSTHNLQSQLFIEKSELVDFIIEYMNANADGSSSTSSSTQSTSHQSPRPSQDSPSAGSSDAPDRQANKSNSHTGTNNFDSSSQTPPNNPTASCKTADSSLNCSTFNLNDIKDENEIKSLSIRQLKLLLTRNYVDFKGCVERDELIHKTTLLWQDKKHNDKLKNELEENSTIDDKCKICMENVIDCVLLDCGHMLTCTDCGKKLSDCPVCRQFVLRIVHVFKA